MSLLLLFGGSTQFIRPDLDITTSGWTDQASGTTNLYAVLDESTLNDSDYVMITV